jgi:thiol:disulfide interchange protein DsbC
MLQDPSDIQQAWNRHFSTLAEDTTGHSRDAHHWDQFAESLKRFEQELSNVKNITVYTFLIPILGGDSPEKSKAIWCAKDNGQVWRNWMLNGTQPPALTGACDTSALDRNLALGLKHGVNGTPMLVFADSKRMAGIMTAEELEKKFASLSL